jgi:hypothetical protein
LAAWIFFEKSIIVLYRARLFIDGHRHFGGGNLHTEECQTLSRANFYVARQRKLDKSTELGFNTTTTSE